MTAAFITMAALIVILIIVYIVRTVKSCRDTNNTLKQVREQYDCIKKEQERS